MSPPEVPVRDAEQLSIPRLSGALILLLLAAGAGGACLQLGGPVAFENDGPSMEPTLADGDRFVVERYGLSLGPLSFGRWGEPEQGDIVVALSPYDGVHIVKRVVAVAGQRVSVDGDGQVRVDGRLTTDRLGPCSDFPERRFPLVDAMGDFERRCTLYEETLGESRHRVVYGGMGTRAVDLVVPEGHVFVMGDHRDRSNDSSNPMIGPIPLDQIVGGYVGTYWEGDS